MAIALLPSMGLAQIPDPALDYVGKVIESHEKSRGNFWQVRGVNPVPGGLVIRFALDVTQDGKDEWFYRSTSLEDLWTVYSPTASGYRVLTSEAYLGEGVGGRIREDAEDLVVTNVWSRYADLIRIVENRFRADGSFTKQVSEVEGFDKVQATKNQPDWPTVPWGKGRNFENAERITLMDFLSGKDAKWSPYDFKYRAMAQWNSLPNATPPPDAPPFTVEDARRAFRRLKDEVRTASTANQALPTAESGGGSASSRDGKGEAVGATRSPALWIGVASAVLLVLAGFFAFRRKPAAP